MIFGKHDEFPEKGAPFSGTFWLPEKFLATVAYFSGSGQAKKQHKKKIPEKPFSGTVFREAKMWPYARSVSLKSGQRKNRA